MFADRLEGEVVGSTFRSPEGGWAVLRVRTPEGEEHTVVGVLAHVLEGQRLVAEGQWVADARFGRQFKAERSLVEDPRTIRGLERYLATAMAGVGEELARRIVDHFGLQTLQVLSDAPDRLLEVPGIGPRTKDKILEHWETDVAGREVVVMLRGFEVPAAACTRVLQRFGKDALAVVTRTPYRLTEVAGIGFRTADAIARHNGIARDDPGRLQAAVEWLLASAEDEGHTFLPEAVLVERLVGLDVPAALAPQAVDRLAAEGRVHRRPHPDERARPVYRPSMDRLEAEVARLLRARVGARGATVDVATAERKVGLELAPGQRAAVEAAWNGGLVVITGGPGTGKTTIVRVLLAAARGRGETWLLAAPTGRAAKRLTESTGAEAKTLHRLLEYSMTEQRFLRDEDKPLEADGVLVDEASMVDLRLVHALLVALPPTCRLVLVGDHDQLPSVGAGRVLGDVIDSGAVPVARLTEVYRQAQDSAIVRNAWRVLAGERPVSAEREAGRRDCFVVEREEPDALRAALLEVVTTRLPRQGFDPRTEVQVLTPMHGGPLGTVALNEALQAALNPPPVLGAAELKSGKRVFRVGDRVIQTRNDYDNDVFNGDVGRVVEVTPAALAVDFEGRQVLFGLDALDRLELAWAISIHKSQGSEYPAVVVVLHTSHFVMLRRNLLYTALTRAKRFACVLTNHRALTTAVGRTGGDSRFSGLAERLGVGA